MKRDWPNVVLLAMLVLLPLLFVSGCGAKPGNPTVTPVTALNRPGECAYCHKQIERVEQKNLVTFDGVEYIVCDEKCAQGQKVAADR